MGKGIACVQACRTLSGHLAARPPAFTGQRPARRADGGTASSLV